MSKSSISFRCCKDKIQVYRHQHRKQTLIFRLDHDLANAADFELGLANEIERAHWQRFLQQYTTTLRHEWLNHLIERGLDTVMGDIADALELLAQDDPNGELPHNRQCGYGIWHQWDRITRVVSSVSHWGIKQAEAKKALWAARRNTQTKRF